MKLLIGYFTIRVQLMVNSHGEGHGMVREKVFDKRLSRDMHKNIGVILNTVMAIAISMKISGYVLLWVKTNGTEEAFAFRGRKG